MKQLNQKQKAKRRMEIRKSVAELLKIGKTEFNIKSLGVLFKIYSRNTYLRDESINLFKEFLQKIQSVEILTKFAAYLMDYRRINFSGMFLKMVKQRRFELETNWDGVWNTIPYIGVQPFDVYNLDKCLEMAECARNKQIRNAWLNRYVELNGSRNDKKYISVLILGWANSKEKPPKLVRRLLHEYFKLLPNNELQKALRDFTPTTKSEAKNNGCCNKYIIYWTLLIYSEGKVLDLKEYDWNHIGNCSLFLNNKVIQGIVLRNISSIERRVTTDLFERLVELHGFPNEDASIESPGIHYSNIVWKEGDVLRRPVNADARRILVNYSRDEFD